MAELSDPRVAVYIDFDNIVISRYDEVYGRGKFMSDKARNIGAPKKDAAVDERAERAIVDVGAIIDYATSFGTVVISRSFADWSVPANAKYSKQLVDRAVDLTQMFPTAAYSKNGADIRLSVDVVEDMFRLPDITHVVIVAGDSDFIPLAQRCKRLGRYVIGIGVTGATSPQLAAACNEFKYYGDLPGVKPAKVDAPAQVTTPLAEAVEAPEPTEADAAPVETKKPATRRRASSPQQSPADAAAPADPAASATDLLLRAARLQHAKTDDEWLHSSSLKLQMLRMDPSFNEKSLGYKTFSDFVKSRDSLVQAGKGEFSGRVKLKDTAA
jgi:hypothetical protein